jgi:cytochrome c peroxidase
MSENNLVRALVIFVFLIILTASFTVVFSIQRQSPTGPADEKLQKVIALYGLRPLSIRRYIADPEWRLGQALFFDPALSGNRDVSCATCHRLDYGLTDGLPRSIGVNGQGFGPDRRLTKGIQVHPRRSLDLWNRDNNSVSAFFWDGHVEVLDSKRKIFRSPMGDSLPKGFQNAMAVQSVFPITVPDEMLGSYGDNSKATLPSPHNDKVNDLIVSATYVSEVDRMKSVHTQLMKRLLGAGSATKAWQLIYRALFERAYPAKQVAQMSIVDLGNAIAHFEELAFGANQSPWDQYVAGDRNAISDQAKAGALLFYGKARCAACHAGVLFSDFQYHNVGIFSQIYVGGKLVNDYGRGAVTRMPEDRYKFRTPPLRNVSKRSPYFHDGSTTTLYDAIIRHLNPLEKAGTYRANGAFALDRDQIDSISPILVPKVDLSDREVREIVVVLSTLDSQSRDRDQIVPSRVPSGIPINY